ncbi:MAG TPA: hypothetical protein ENI94_10855 [Gammaproteobacteria bacterium]|nr:hypothetical protein [Gammaproteobacteria bacterium]
MKGNHPRRTATALAALFGLGLAGAPAMAEDIEVFLSQPANTAAPNVLFILDTSRSMNAGNPTRLTTLKNSLNAVLLPAQPYKKLNVGIMDFNGKRSGGIDFPITSINSDASLVDADIPAETKVGTVLDYISKSYTTLTEGGFDTPMGDALFFASRYYSGAQVFNSGTPHGERNLPAPTWNSSTNRYTGGDREADNPAAYNNDNEDIIKTSTQVADTRPCYVYTGKTKPAGQGSMKKCGDNPYSCGGYINYETPAQLAQYRVRTYSCDSSGLECLWDAPPYTTGEHVNCSAEPTAPQNGSTWVECKDAQPASNGTYQHCTEEYTYEEQSWSAVNYDSPIQHTCQSNHVVLLSDGEPTRLSTQGPIAALLYPNSDRADHQRYLDCADLSNQFTGKIPANGRCLPELVEHMATADQSTVRQGTQTISTYTIGFELSGNTEAQNFLRLLANKGTGQYFDANSPAELVTAFKQIIREVTSSDVSFSTPSVTINPNNRLETSNALYRTEFTPSDKPAWRGDVIKAVLSFDANGNPTFTDSSTTLAGTLDSNTRNIYTYLGTSDLTGTGNAFTTGNNALTSALLQHSNTVTRENLIRWVRGEDVQNEDGDSATTQRKHMGDSLHTTPALVNYTSTTAVPLPQQVLYVPTNDGLLHAFDVTTDPPTELFAFIPPELLPNLDTLYHNSNTATKVYGLDGNMTIWQTPSRTYLYFGMRRGGRNYYALDITNPTIPQMLWTIKGGVANSTFAELGQTWSTPQLTSVMVNSVRTKALIFAGGYDTNQDAPQDKTTPNTRRDDNQGRAIYIVNALTGAKIWSAGPADSGHDYTLALTNSIPSDVRIIDLDGNGLVDRLYVGDTGGRVWRIDINQTNVTGSSGYLLADFATDNSVENTRRFYYPPSVAFDRQRRLMVAIGSGYRAHPTATGTTDRFYVFEDQDASLGPPTTSRSAITDTTLANISTDIAHTGTEPGWYLNLRTKEKVLAESVIFNNNVIFTSYEPNFQNTSNDACQVAGSTPRAYMLALEDGRPVVNFDDIGGNARDALTLTDRSKSLGSVNFIPSAPYITFNPGTAGNADAGDPLPPPAPPCASAFVGEDLLDTTCSVNRRVAWKNR